MKLQRLGDIVKNLDSKRIPLNSEERIAKSKKGLYPYIGANNIVGYIDEYIFNEKILCVAEDGGNWGANQKCAVIYEGKTWVNNHAHVLVENGNANLEYLKNYLNYTNLNKHIKGATRGKLNKSVLENLLIPVPSLPDQLHIANLLSKAENLIAQRKESIRLLDEYLKSTFLEMFGDPIANKKKWKLLQVSEYGVSRLGKMLDGKKIIGNNLKPYLRNSNVLWFGFKLDDLLEMDFDEKDRIEFSLKHGDILMCEGGEIGRCAIWRGELEECYFQKAIHRIRLNKNIALPEYFVYMFWLHTMNGGLNKYMGAATISHLTGEKLKKMKLPIPPIELQTQFAQIVEKTETLKTQYQQSLQELENLYGSLSQKAFRGELSIKDESLLMAAEPLTPHPPPPFHPVERL